MQEHIAIDEHQPTITPFDTKNQETVAFVWTCGRWRPALAEAPEERHDMKFESQSLTTERWIGEGVENPVARSGVGGSSGTAVFVTIRD
jgi:hypothetical protein